MKRKLAIIFTALALLIIPAFAFAQNDQPDYGDTTNTGYICPAPDDSAATNDFVQCIPRLYNFALGISGIIAMGVLIAAGYLYMTAGGDGQQLGTAKEMMAAVAAGIVLLSTAYILLKFLDPNLLRLEGPSLEISKGESGAAGAGGAGQAQSQGTQQKGGSGSQSAGGGSSTTSQDIASPTATITKVMVGTQVIPPAQYSSIDVVRGTRVVVTTKFVDDRPGPLTVCYFAGTNNCLPYGSMPSGQSMDFPINTTNIQAASYHLIAKVTDASGKEGRSQVVLIVLK